MHQRNKGVTIAVKLVITLIVCLPGLAIVGYVGSQNRNIGSVLAMTLAGVLLAIWYYTPQNPDGPKPLD